jgi:hypothetical protein
LPNHSFCFFRWARPLFYSLNYCLHILGMLGIDCSCICHLFLTRLSHYLFRCNNTCWNWHFFIPDGTMRHSSPAIPSLSLLGPTLWKPNGLILSPVIVFFDRSLTRVRLYLTSNKCSFIYHANTFLFMCGSRGKCLVVNLSYHIDLLSIPNPFLYNITYLFWITTSYDGPSFMVLVWSYH